MRTDFVALDVRMVSVLRAVHFDDETQDQASGVRNIRTDDDLSPEMPPIDIEASQVPPKNVLSGRRIFAQPFRGSPF